MNPLPPAVIARWSSNWSPEAHPERPWWCAVHSAIMTGPLVRWRRSDGRETGHYKVPVTWGTHDNPALFFLDTPRAELARIDAAHPLPHPGYYPEQVWVEPDGTEICGDPRDEDGRLRASPSAILVYGPSQYGANTPWSPA